MAEETPQVEHNGEQAKRLMPHQFVTQAYVQPSHKRKRVLRYAAAFLLFVILAFTALPSFQLYSSSKYDKLAKVELHKIREAVYSKMESDSNFVPIQYFDLIGPKNLENSIPSVQVSKDIRVNYILSAKRASGNVIMISVSHLKGNNEYRWSDIYGEKREQKIGL